MPYYNTNNLKARLLIHALTKAETQYQKVKIIMNCYGKMTASEVHEFFSNKTPITSIRRAMSDLQTDKFLIILDETKESPLGSTEHFYQVNNQLNLF